MSDEDVLGPSPPVGTQPRFVGMTSIGDESEEDDSMDQDEDGEDAWQVTDLLSHTNTLAARAPPSERQLRNMVKELGAEWLNRDVRICEIAAWGMERLSLSSDDKWLFSDFETSYQKRRHQYSQLVHLLNQKDMLVPEDPVVDVMTSIDRVIAAVYNACFTSFVAYNRIDGIIRNVKNPPTVMDEETVDFHDDETLTNFQKLVLILCKRFEAQKYRKADGCCFRPMKNYHGDNTHAYEHVTTIEKEIYDLQKEISFEHWKLLTNPPNNPRQAVEYFTKSEQTELRTLDVGSGDWYSFRNGVYNILYDLFFRFDQRSEWPEYARDMAAARGYTAAEYPYPDDSTVCVNFFDVDFTFLISPDNPTTPDPMQIPTPSMDSIFDAQDFDDDTKEWAYAFTGRCFFRPNRLERWQRAFFEVGQGGTGKSTHLGWVAYVVPAHFHSVLNSNFEPQFGLSGLAKDVKRLCICYELTEEMSMRQEEFQNCAEATVVQPATKGVTSERHLWQQHMILAGNQWPKKWKNNRGQISRRAFTLLYNKVVPKDQMRGDLSEDLKRETPSLLRKCCIAYVNKASEHGKKDLEASNVLPVQIRGFINDMTSQIDPLKSFVGSDTFLLSPDTYMPVEEFKKLYADWRKSNGFSIQPWLPEHYDHTFQVKGISMGNARLTYLGEELHAPFLFGIGLAPPKPATTALGRGSSSMT